MSPADEKNHLGEGVRLSLPSGLPSAMSSSALSSLPKGSGRMEPSGSKTLEALLGLSDSILV